jgi:hypothetical protein
VKLCTRPELVWVNSLARFGQKRWPAAFESKDPQPCGPARSKHPRCEKRHFLSHLYIKTITLPRQTRDKHRGKCALILMPALSLSWQCSSSYNRAVEKTPPALAHRGIRLSDGYRRVLLPEQGQRSSLAPRLERVLVNQACCQSRGNPADRQSDRSADTDNRKEILPIEPEERR